jgi:hypothetical protein
MVKEKESFSTVTVAPEKSKVQGQFVDDQRYALAMYEQYEKALKINKTPEGKEALEKLRDEWKEKAGDLIREPKKKES